MKQCLQHKFSKSNVMNFRMKQETPTVWLPTLYKIW